MERARRDRRNARDRLLVERKKQNADKMRAEVMRLEREQQSLQQQFEQRLHMNEANTSRNPLPLRYLSVIRQSERLHAENAAMRAELSRRELVMNAVEDVVDQFHHENQQDNNLVEFPVSEAGAFQLADAVCKQCDAVFRRSAVLPVFTAGNLFGWKDLRCRVGDHLDFAIQKTFAYESATVLLSKAWRQFTTSPTFFQLSPTLVTSMPTTHFFSDCVAIACANLDHSKTYNDDDCVLFVQACSLEGKAVLLIASFNSRTYERELQTTEPLHLACYWAFEDMLDEQQQTGVLVRFGGSLPNASARTTHSVMAELVFNVIRWEMQGVRPSLMFWGDDDQHTS